MGKYFEIEFLAFFACHERSSGDLHSTWFWNFGDQLINFLRVSKIYKTFNEETGIVVVHIFIYLGFFLDYHTIIFFIIC